MEGEREPESRPSTHGILDSDSAAVTFDNLLADVESNAQAGRCNVHLVYATCSLERAPDPFALPLGDAGAKVTHRYPRLRALCAVLDAQRDDNRLLCR